MIYAEILAGGKGTRMGNVPMPKQFLTLGTKPIVIHTLEKFLLNSRFNVIVVVVPMAWVSYMKNLVKEFLDSDERIRVVEGGADRNATLMNGIKAIDNEFGLNDDDVIITHDSVRPFITHRIIEDNIDGVLEYGAVDTVIPAIDTIVEAHDNILTDIPQRSAMYQGQTPQSFNIKKLVTAFASLTDDEKETLTDAAKIMVLKGDGVHIVTGDQSNFKVTTSFDLNMAQALVGKRED
ncbi:2-C-methyl-D-erythritol 4-phosphate cytidylyltransferase [Periweissella cryptocerci]|uniref:Ribitol-5-phosphate cytidylyltransferase n=1 Tax=Periweissella cryptocerci TaxID=2506420 RepID=A0A4P6YSJ2_9LACO|nr:2-C-methyl-D-erythritol 4-phosphate cytidylyltransferase [Periweissella cryptocerci]QBO35602.1 2-C-methyl-D-erythritol 4-phosphate cytidylyltransferase [Periweissella cryptocerci]